MWRGKYFKLIDTGGLTFTDEVPLEEDILKQSERAIKKADIIVFVTDAKTGILPQEKELAKRIIAKPGKRDYSRLSAVVQYAADVSQVAQIGPSSFFPKPDVDSTILKFNFFEPGEMNFEQEKILFNVIKAAFSKRRKSLKNAMTGGEFEFEKNFITQALESAGIDAIRRAETLTVEEFKSLAMAVWEKTGTR